MAGIKDIQTGELIRMIEKRDRKLHRLEVDLDRVAQILGVAGMGERERGKHKKERERFHKILSKEGQNK